MFLFDNLNNMQIVVGVFGAKMTVSFRSSGVGPNAGILGSFGQPMLDWRLPLGGPMCVIVLLGRFKMNCLNCLLA